MIPPQTSIDRLKSRCAWDSTPKLSEDDLIDILTDCALVDSFGLKPVEANWVPSYDLNLAAQHAWERKAGLASSCVDFSSDGEKWDRSQIKSHCDQMAETYRRKRTTSLGPRDALGRSLALLPWQIGNGPDRCCE